MTVSTPLLSLSFVAAADLSSSQYKIVQFASTAGQVKLATSATSKTVGVLLNDPASGEVAEVQVLGVARVLSENSVTVGGVVCSSSTGRAKLTTTGGDRIIGYALDAGDAGDIIRVLMMPSVNGD